MPDEPTAVLVAEIGSVTTRVSLVDSVAGEARLIGQAEVSSTTEPPYENAVIGVLEAAAQIGEATGRQLIQDDGTLLMPQTSERDGISSLIALTSAAGLMGIVITAVASERFPQSAAVATSFCVVAARDISLVASSTPEEMPFGVTSPSDSHCAS